MKPRQIELVQEGTRLLARVPLGGEPGIYAEMWKDDFDFLIRLGLSPNWACYRGNVGFYVTASAVESPSNRVLVARVLLDADAGQMVRYADGNPLNMRRENLRVVANAKAKTRARAFIRSKNILEIFQ